MEEKKSSDLISLEGMKLSDVSVEEFREIMEDLRKSNQEQADYAKRTWIISLIAAIAIFLAAAGIMVSVAMFMPRLNKMLDEVEVSLENIETITSDVAAMDLDTLMGDVSELVTSTEDSLAQAMKKIDAIDVEGLNSAVEDLNAVTNELALFFGVKKR